MIAPASTPPSVPALTLPLRSPRAGIRAPVLTPELDTQPRFTVDGSAALERHLAQTCAKIAAGVRGLVPQGRLEALLLGGGYGRGEGGVLRTPEGDRPYNDLEFYVCIRGNRHLNEARFGRPLHVLGEILTPQAGIEVEFKITSLAELERSSVSMFSYDLLMGHRCLVGDEALLARCAHHRDAENIPLSEATRLLMNRCSGLLFAREKLQQREFTGHAADFVARNIAKAELALGDAVLVAHGQYHWSVQERHRRLERLARIESIPWLLDVCARHAAGVTFKLHPDRSTAPREELAARHAPVTELAQKVWLWLEDWRLHARFGSTRNYALCSRNKCPESSPVRNRFVALKSRGLAASLSRRASRHPREDILHALTLLLWEPEALTSPPLLCHLQRSLRTPATTFPDLMRAYRALWSKVN